MTRINEIVDMDPVDSDVPHFGLNEDGILYQDNWTSQDFKDFMADFHGVDTKNLNDSALKVANDCFEELMKQGVGRINAELMAAGIEWYLDKIVRENE